MMINRIVQATNLLSYVDFNWDSVNLPNEDGNDVSSFKRRNIIFAENGNGKSNLIKMLVAMKVNGDIPKNWYLKTDPSKLIVSVDGEPNNIEYDCTGWKNNVLTKKVILFDAEFIDRYVHSTGKPATGAGNRDTERGKNIVYLGNFGSHNKDIEKLIEVKDALQRKTTALLNINTRAIQAIIPNTMKISDVCAAKVDIEAADSAKVDKNKLERSKLTEARGKLAKALKQEKEIAALQSLISHSIKPILKGTRVVGGEEEEYDLAVPTLFDFSVSEAVKKALAAVEHKQHFIKEGVGLLDSDPKHCPFCEQNIDGIALTDSYKEIFTEEFTDSEATIEKALRFYKELLGALRDVQQPSENAARLVEAKKYVSIETELNGIATTEAEKTLINDEVSRVTGTNVSELQMVVERVKGEIDKYNTSVDAVNKAITKLKTDSSGGKIGERITELDVKIAQLEIDIIYAENQKELIIKIYLVMIIHIIVIKIL